MFNSAYAKAAAVFYKLAIEVSWMIRPTYTLLVFLEASQM